MRRAIVVLLLLAMPAGSVALQVASSHTVAAPPSKIADSSEVDAAV